MSDSVSRSFRKGEEAMVPPAPVRSYYGHPILKEPVWTWEVPAYFFTGGTAGASAVLAMVAHDPQLSRAARLVAAGAAAVSPPLLISDLGVPSRFLNMLRVFKVTSPLSVGSWLLSVFVPAAVGSAMLAEVGVLPRFQRLAQLIAGVLGPALSTYTAVLIADTAIPAWQEARRELPLVFAAGSAAAAGAAAILVTPLGDVAPARRLAIAGAALEVGGSTVMEKRLGPLGEPYRQGAAGRYRRLARALGLGGAGLLMLRRERRTLERLGAALVLGGSVLERWAVFRAGFQSARDPGQVVLQQRGGRSPRDS